MRKNWKKIGQMLIDKGLITEEQLKEALESQKETNQFLGRILVEKGFIKEEDLLSTLSGQLDIPVICLKDKYIDYQWLEKFPLSAIFDHHCLPFKEEEENIWVAMSNPLKVEAISAIQKVSVGKKVKPAITSHEEMEEALARCRHYFREKIKRLLES